MSAPYLLPLLHRDDDLIVVCKPAGLLVHRSMLDAQEDDNALDRLRAQLGDAAPPGLAPAHRLDKGTSGVLVFACHADAARALGAAFESGTCDKRYIALLRGWPADEVTVDYPLARDPELPSAGQPRLPAVTHLRTLSRGEWPLSTRAGFASTRVALVEARPESGRRHQIRRHAKQIGHPLIGDATHGKGPLNRAVADELGLQRLWLHALTLRLPHPRSGALLQLRAELGPEWALPTARGTWVTAPGGTR